MSMMGTVISLWLYGGRSGTTGQGMSRGTADGGMEKARIDSLLLTLSRRLGSPLTALSANIRFLAGDREQPPDAELAGCLESMGRSVEDLESQCQRLLTFMRLELQDDTGESSWAHPAELISSLLPRMVERGRQRDVTVRADLPGEPFLACYDPAFMEQIVTNLVENAISFNRPGGEVSITVGTDGGVWTLEVADTGRGIDSVDLPHVFDGFHAQKQSGAAGDGLGIGLAIVKRLTELQGGVISVWSKQDSGSRFILRFPLSG
jgi:signal transduction histidine kinase